MNRAETRQLHATDAEMLGAVAGREWSEAELSELGDMLVRPPDLRGDRASYAPGSP